MERLSVGITERWNEECENEIAVERDTLAWRPVPMFQRFNAQNGVLFQCSNVPTRIY
ncbi:MAG: hypothetical protein AAGD96_24340 [Chloroflexota bacterium]